MPLRLANLTAMQQLTRLRVEYRKPLFAPQDEVYAVAAMQPIANALTSLTSLRSLTLKYWTTVPGPVAHACWLALANALPTLPHLNTLSLCKIVLPGAFDPFPFNTLSASLSRLSFLRHLVLGGHDAYPKFDIELHAADCRTASARLAAALGTLTRLQSLELGDLCRFLSWSDCHHHLQGLTGLSHLSFVNQVEPEVSGYDTGGDSAGVISLLVQMSQLQRLLLWGDHDCNVQTIHRLVSDAVPALHLLTTLVLPDGIEHASCVLLAENARDGRLPHLQRVGLVKTAEQLAELNVYADIFDCLLATSWSIWKPSVYRCVEMQCCSAVGRR